MESENIKYNLKLKNNLACKNNFINKNKIPYDRYDKIFFDKDKLFTKQDFLLDKKCVKTSKNRAKLNKKVVKVALKNNNFDISIAGFVPLTTIDYPGCLAAVVFCRGCYFRCSYCHNPDLISFKKNLSVQDYNYKWSDIKNFLLERRNFLEAIVFSGGEPTLQKILVDAVKEVRQLGFKVGIHTSGVNPGALRKLLSIIDWVGMDIKAPFDSYEKITKVKNSGSLVLESAKQLIKSGIAYEFRTTVHPKLISEEQILKIACSLKGLGATVYKLQHFRENGCRNKNLRNFYGKILSTKNFNKIKNMFLKFSVDDFSE